MLGRVFSLIAITAFSSFGCDALRPPPPKPFESRIRVFSDPGTPLKGAEVFYKQKRIGVTDDAGTVNFKLKGAEGETFDLTVKCPFGPKGEVVYSNPQKAVVVTLRKTADVSMKPEYNVDCPRVARTIVVAVRADSGPNLPVMFLNREVARTDVSGAAHVLLEVPPNQMFSLQISTNGDEAKDLRPQNPTATFEVKQEDAVFVFDQKFKLERKRVVSRGKPKPSGPTPL